MKSKSPRWARRSNLRRSYKRTAKDMMVVVDDFPGDIVDHEPRRFSPQWSIFRVPVHIRRVNEKAYNPRVVSIGPFHRNRPSLRSMEAHKARFYDRLMTHVAYEDRGVSIKMAMRKLEPDARRCYMEELDDINIDEFFEMMVLDGCFIAELMRLYRESR